MATAFIGLVLITLIGNTVITKSKTKWWRDPGSLFRNEDSGARRKAQARQPWEVTPRQEARPRREVQSRQEAMPERERTPRQEFAPRQEVAPRREFATQGAGQVATEAAPRAGRHAMRPTPAVPIEHAETEIIARIPGGPARY